MTRTFPWGIISRPRAQHQIEERGWRKIIKLTLKPAVTLMEFLFALLGIALVLGFLISALVLPIVAYIRTRRISELGARLRRLEADVQRRLPDNEPAAATGEDSRLLLELQERLDRVERILEQRQPLQQPSQLSAPVTPVAAQEHRPAPRPTPIVAQAAPITRWKMDAASVESWIGRRGLGWIAVVLLLFTTAFFLKFAFDNNWIGELGRVTLGVLAGAGLCTAGLRYHHQGWRVFSQMLSAGGVVLLYLVTFSAFGYYHLIPQGQAAFFLIVLVAESAALAALYEAPAIALMAVVGGLLTPILLHSDHDQYTSLFTYLIVLNAGMAGLAQFRRWPAIGTVALLGTQLLFWVWYSEHYHPDKLVAAVAFQAIIFALYLAYGAAGQVVAARRATVEGIVRVVLNAALTAAAGFVLLDEDYHICMGTLAIGAATAYATLGWLLLTRRPEDQLQLFVVVATAMGFVACVFPLQAEAAWIPVGWAVQGALLWWFGLRIQARALHVLGAVLLALSVGRLVIFDTPYSFRQPFVPIFNSYAIPALSVAVCVLGAAALTRRTRRRDANDYETILARLTGLVGVGLVWLILSIETSTYFSAQAAQQQGDPTHFFQSARTALSVVWAAYAAVLLSIGFWLGSLSLRWAALALFGLTLGKVLLVDMAALPGLYRVLAFFILSLMMGGAAWGYQKVQSLHQGLTHEDADHDAH